MNGRVSEGVSVCAGGGGGECTLVRACMHVCVCDGVCVCVCLCVRDCVCVCVHASVRVCVGCV